MLIYVRQIHNNCYRWQEAGWSPVQTKSQNKKAEKGCKISWVKASRPARCLLNGQKSKESHVMDHRGHHWSWWPSEVIACFYKDVLVNPSQTKVCIRPARKLHTVSMGAFPALQPMATHSGTAIGMQVLPAEAAWALREAGKGQGMKGKNVSKSTCKYPLASCSLWDSRTPIFPISNTSVSTTNKHCAVTSLPSLSKRSFPRG